MAKIIPSKSVPQAPRQLRVGSKGYARARAAEAQGKAPPDEREDDDEDEDEDAGDAASKQAAHDEIADKASASYRAAADAAEATKGTDSASAHMAAEAAHDEAVEAGAKMKASCIAMRGGAPDDADPDSVRSPSPAPAAAPQIGAKATAEGHIATARAAEFGAYALAQLGLGVGDVAKAKSALTGRLSFAAHALAVLGEKDPVRAKGVLGAKLDQATKAAELAKKLGATTAQSEEQRRTKLWEDAVRERKFQLRQVFAREEVDGKPVRVLSDYAKAQNAAYPELPAFEAWISSRVPEPGAVSAEPSSVLAELAEQRAQPAHQLSARDVMLAARAGVDPAELAAVIARRQSANADPAAREGV